MIEVRVNGGTREVPADTTLSGLLEELGLAPSQVAVERNRVIVRRGDYDATRLEPADELEIVTLVGGG